MFWSKEDERQWRDLDAKRKMAEEARNEKLDKLHSRVMHQSPTNIAYHQGVDAVFRHVRTNADEWIAALEPFRKEAP